MKRREFLLGTGSLFLAGCAGGGQRDWAEVPWVAQGPPPPPPTLRPSAPLSTTPAPAAPPPNARPLTAPPKRAAYPPPKPLPRAPAVCGGGTYTLVRRDQWGAACLRANHDPMGAISRITLHHTDEHAGMRGRSDAEVVRAIQGYHQDQLGWADIGYHFLVGSDGRVYEGRALSAQGAHSGGANNINNVGVSVIGNFSKARPPGRQLEALSAFLTDLKASHGVSGAGMLGHRDLGPTECPGEALYGWLQEFKRA